MNSFLALSLGLCLSLGLTWLFARKCARWLDDSWWSREFGIQVWLTVIWSVFGVILPMRNGFANFSHGLIPVGLSPSPRPRLRELAAAWRPGPLEIMTWVWLAGFVLCFLWQVAAIVRVHWRVRRESRPAGEAIQKALARVSRTMDGGVLDGYAADSLPSWEVRVLPGLPGPMSVVVGPKKLLLDREDYDDETLDAILRHELVHIHGRTVSGSRAFLVVVCAAYWFNPLVWLLRREMRAREEYTCDREANLGRTPEERRAYAHAMASLAAKGRREWPGTAGMACAQSTLRRRVEALFRAERPRPRWQKRLSAALLCVASIALVLGAMELFSCPAHYTLSEENLLQYVGQGSSALEQGMDPAALTEVEDEFFVRMETRTPPYGAAAVYCRARSLYLAFSDSAAADEACAGLSQRLTVLLGEGEAADGDRLYLTDDTLFRMLEQPPAGGTFERRALGAWRGTTDTGTETITLARADAETGAVVALLWGEKVETQPLPFDIEVFIIDTAPQNDSAPSGTE